MAICGKDRRNAILEKILRYLCIGDVSSAAKYLSSLESADIKNKKWLEGLLGYFEKKGDAITCYALRAKLSLRNSSNPIEKANDLTVAGRQKHNGITWSPNGSGALAALQMIYLNHQPDLWFHRKELRLFSPSLETTPKAAYPKTYRAYRIFNTGCGVKTDSSLVYVLIFYVASHPREHPLKSILTSATNDIIFYIPTAQVEIISSP